MWPCGTVDWTQLQCIPFLVWKLYLKKLLIDSLKNLWNTAGIYFSGLAWWFNPENNVQDWNYLLELHFTQEIVS